MRVLKISSIVFFSYVGIVVLFESYLGYFQPRIENTLVITVSNDSAVSNDRVISRLESANNLYIAVNHWPRFWYYNVLDNPELLVDLGDGKNTYLAIPVTDEGEYDRVNQDNPLPLAFRFLTGFPPRYFLRLESQ